jgi:hypothetical protein
MYWGYEENLRKALHLDGNGAVGVDRDGASNTEWFQSDADGTESRRHHRYSPLP